jgi:hypothetical protein
MYKITYPNLLKTMYAEKKGASHNRSFRTKQFTTHTTFGLLCMDSNSNPTYSLTKFSLQASLPLVTTFRST